jgi:hypothetical protein
VTSLVWIRAVIHSVSVAAKNNGQHSRENCVSQRFYCTNSKKLREEICTLVGYYIAGNGNSVPTFWDR